MVQVKGIETREVTCEINNREIFRALCSALDMEKFFYPEDHNYYKKIFNNKREIVSVKLYSDMSWYGSSSDSLIHSIVDDNSLELFIILEKLKEKLNVKN